MNDSNARALSEQFLEKHKNVNKYPFTNGKIFQFCEERNKSFFDITEKEFIDFFYDYVKINSVETLNCYRMTYARFYQWCIDCGYIDKRNLFEESVYLDPDTLADYMAKKCSLYYYDDADIDFICRKTRESPVLCEAIIRCFYEGIASYDELVYLKQQQVDLDHNCIHLGDRTIHITGKLSLLLNKLMIGEVDIEEGKNGYTLQRLGEEDVFLFRIVNDSAVNRKQFLKRRLDKVAENAGVKVTSKLLYQSGLFQSIRKSCNNDDDQLIRVLYEDKNKHTNFVLDHILKENGYAMKANRARYIFKPYMFQLIATRK